jgi:hypothetical protein
MSGTARCSPELFPDWGSVGRATQSPSQGDGIEQVAADYRVTAEQVRAALSYAADLVASESVLALPRRRIVLRDVLHARLKVCAGLRCVDDSQRFNALPIARCTFCVDSPSPRSIA